MSAPPCVRIGVSQSQTQSGGMVGADMEGCKCPEAVSLDRALCSLTFRQVSRIHLAIVCMRMYIAAHGGTARGSIRLLARARARAYGLLARARAHYRACRGSEGDEGDVKGLVDSTIYVSLTQRACV